MRLILDTNILISALMVRGTPPDMLYDAWRLGRFELVSCDYQLEEINQVSRRPAIRERLKPSEAGKMVNDIRRLAILFDHLPQIDISPDPDDNFLLALAGMSAADFIVTGDKSDLLGLQRYHGARIVTARYMAGVLGYD